MTSWQEKKKKIEMEEITALKALFRKSPLVDWIAK